MVYTVTFNPAIDYVVHTGDMVLGQVNRSNAEEMYFGGKGINVSIVLKELGIESKALGFVAGFTGEAIEKGVSQMGVHTDFVKLEKGNSRINVKIKSAEETELNGQGPDIDDEAIAKLFEKLDKLTDGDTIILAGSIPNSLPSDIYERIIERLSDRKIKVVVDATKDLLMNVLKYKPFLIKPNNHELGEIFGVKLETRESVVEYAQKLLEMGAENVIISMAGEGAVFVNGNGEVYMREAPKGKLVNGVGAGDSMVAGFIAGYLTEKNLLHAFKLGLSSGSASAFSENLATKEEIMKVYSTVE